MKNLFDRDYYENGKASGVSLYENYRWLPELTVPLAEAIVAGCGINRSDVILDFGCAKGYLVKALRQNGFLAYGTDVSEYALSQADEEIRKYLASDWWHGQLRAYDWVICKDVLEHVSEEELPRILSDFRNRSQSLFIAVPLGNNGAFTIPEMELDVTHKIRRPLWWWTAAVEDAGFKVAHSAFSMKGIKENWTRKVPMGNGFIIAK